MSNLKQQTKNHWQQLRGMTYDFLDVIQERDLGKKLPFPESQTLGYQFNCMLGAEESNLSMITKGEWEGFTSSLSDSDEFTIPLIKKHMQEADKQLFEAIDSVDLLKEFSDGSTPLMNYMVLVEHEALHQGQIVNYMYAVDLEIPESWASKWALKKD